MNDMTQLIEAGQEAFRGRDWVASREAFIAAREKGDLRARDFDALAESSWWLGEIDESLAAYEAAHRLHLKEGEPGRASMSAMFLAVHSTTRGDVSIGSGWMNRVHRLLSDQPEGAEHGYPSYLQIFSDMARGDLEGAASLARGMQEIGRRFRDPNLIALGVLGEGRALIKGGTVGEGMRLLDEAMLAALSEELHPMWTGAIYCHLMDVCRELSDLRRAGEWTRAASRWCETLPKAALYRGICRVHRAQVLQAQGEWEEAEQEAILACDDARSMHVVTVAEGQYELGEVRRLRGDLEGAEDAYKRAHELGRHPQPGLALLRLAQGRVDAGAASIRAALAGETFDRLARARLCAAQVEIALAAGDTETARLASQELEATAKVFGSSGLHAASEQASGAVLLADNKASESLRALRAAYRLWQELDAPYNGARSRLLLAVAFRALGDDDAAALELSAAHRVFERLGATLDARRVAELRNHSSLPDGLTEREAQVLRLVATGKSNRGIATDLVLSQKTVERHLSNIFSKLGISSRTEATAYAFEHGLGRARG
jgi:DNA-binding NarL/FixJ family response regulator